MFKITMNHIWEVFSDFVYEFGVVLTMFLIALACAIGTAYMFLTVFNGSC